MSREKTGTPLGSLYPYLQKLADSYPPERSFLNPAFSSLEDWQQDTRRQLWDKIPDPMEPCPFDVEIVETVDQGDYLREKLYFSSHHTTRVPAFFLTPKQDRQPLPALLCLHDHGGMYLWGKEKIVEVEDEHRWLTAFKERCYEGTSYASEFCKAGYAVMVIDAFYWGERRLISDQDIELGRNTLAPDEPDEHYHELVSQAHYGEDTIARALYQLGHTWQGLWLRDEIRSLDYLCSRPEVDPDRLGCVGLSIGGFRSAQLAGMDPRIKCAVVDGWMTTYGEMFKHLPGNTHYLQYLTGGYRLVDLPDLVSLCCPGALMVLHGTQDHLFTARGVADAYEKIQAVYEKAGYGDRTDLRYYDAPHEFNRQQQSDALAWLNRWLSRIE